MIILLIIYQGVVKNYKNCDDIWIFYAENVSIRTDSENFSTEKLKVVACDKKIREAFNNEKANTKKSEKKESTFEDGEN